MQTQALRNDQNQALITQQQSLQSVQTLLRAGLGCVTYLRNLLPSDNFSESYLTSSGSDSLSSQPSRTDSSFASSDGRRNVSGFKIMTVTRGFTEEADKLLDYLENGIFDAIQRQYLRSFVFAIYLDDQDPNNIIEAYTFNFSYCKIQGANETIPIMTLGEEMMNLSLSGANRAQDPVAEATKKGKLPTLGEVKRSLKTLVKNLIQATTQMDALPKRRFATFKLFYYDNTPDDYEPPHFRAGDASKDKWYMTTHNKGEIPERCSIGSVHTGYHGVDVKVASVSGYLPSGEDNNAPFSGITERNALAAPPLTPIEEAAVRAQQIEAQRHDAVERRIVWDGDDDVRGAEAHVNVAMNSHTGVMASVLGHVVPSGMRGEDGSIIPLDIEEGRKATIDAVEVHYAGRPETMPLCIGQLAQGEQQPGQELSPTQEIEVMRSPSVSVPATPSGFLTPTPKPKHPSSRHANRSPSPLPPSDIVPSVSSSMRELETDDTCTLKNIVMTNTSMPGDDSVMLDMETQQLPGFSSEPIQPFSEARESDILGASDTPMDQDGENELALECECGVQVEDCDLCYCDGGCGRWFHLWCMGYHSAQDHRIPPSFVCFDCRVKADRNWDLIVVHDLYPRMIARFKDLATQRRGIKIFESYAPDGLSAFTKLIGCDSTVAGQVFKRLETEGFIAQECREVDESGFIETASLSTKRKPKGKGKAKARATQRRKILQKPIYIFVQTIKNEDAYKDYFNPDPEVEKKLLGLSDLKPERKTRKKRNEANNPGPEADNFDALSRENSGQRLRNIDPRQDDKQILPAALDSQTQEESQYLIPNARSEELKRRPSGANPSGDPINRKKIKISLGPPVDLGD